MQSIHDAIVAASSRVAVTTILLHSLSSSAFGQSQPRQNPGVALTISQAIASAVASSPDLVASREAVAVARGRERQARARANPTMSYSHEQTGSGALANSQDVLEVEQPVEVGGARGARIQAARLRREAAEAEARFAESRVAYEVAVALAQAVAAERRSALASVIAESFAEAERVSTRRLAAGDVSGFAARRIRLEKNRYAVLRAEAALESRAAMLLLWSLLPPDFDRSRPLDLNLPSVRAFMATLRVDSVALGRGGSRPDIAALALEVRAAAADATVARRERIPVPVLSAGTKREAAGERGSQRGIVAGVRLPLPIWDRGSGDIEAFDAATRRRTAELASLQLRASREIAEASEALRTAEQQLGTVTPQITDDAAATLRAAQTAYAEGEISLVEWLDASRAYHEVEAGFASLRSQYVVRAATLARALGMILTRDAK